MKLEPSSERVMEDAYQSSDAAYAVYMLHIATYRYALPHARDARVLDLGCGSGYGTSMLRDVARSAVGVDVSPEAVAHAGERYGRDGLSFRTIDPARPLPFDDASFDLVTSFQVIEHVEDVDAYLAEARRVLAPGGTFIVVTPDRRLRLFPLQKPWNPWHLVEYDAAGLEKVLRRAFGEVSVSGMGGRPELIGIETRRYARMRILSLPFTLPFIPEAIRQAVLKRLSALRMRRQRTAALSDMARGFTPDDVEIGPGLSPSVNLVAIAKV